MVMGRKFSGSGNVSHAVGHAGRPALRVGFSRQRRIVLFGVFLFVLFFAFLLFVPVRIRVIPKESPLRASTWIDSDTADLEAVSLFGIGYPIRDGYSYQAQDDGDPSKKRLMFWWKYLFYDETLTCKAPDSYEVTYDGDVYAGQKLSSNKVRVKAVYGNDYVDMQHLELPDDVIPMATKVKVPVRTPSGITTWEAGVTVPDGMTVDYAGNCQVGDDFLKSDVSVRLHYPDGTEAAIDDFEIPNAPLYLSEPVTLTVTSDYGEAEFSLEPRNDSGFSVSYPDTVYAGDKLDLEKLSFVKGEEFISDFDVDDPGVIKTQTKLVLSSKYGSGVLVLDPVEIKGADFHFAEDTDWVDGATPKLSSVTIRYDDGSSRDLSDEDYTFLQDDVKLSAGQSKLWIDYHGIRLSTDVTTVKQSTVDVRNENYEGGDFARFSLSDTQLERLSVLGQRLCGDDLLSNAFEASLMANRYDLYGNGGDFFDYILDCGYWGGDARDYATDEDYEADADVADVFRDVLVNGHRQFPGYVDEHAPVGDSSLYEKDVSLVEKIDGSTFRFFATPKAGGDLAYGYSENSYRKVTGSDPAEASTVSIPQPSDSPNIIVE